jgi:hypothetical protein
MKFANKYELFEAVTNGRVETFVAKDLVTGERVLLHIFEAPEKKPEQPTVQWVLESLSKIAPKPPGLVVETGRYSGTTYAYLVTKLPDSTALQMWAQSYESYRQETQEIAIPSENISQGNSATNKDLSRAKDRPAQEATQMPSPTPPGDFTAAFSGLASLGNPRPEANKSGATDLDGIDFGPEKAPPKREPGEFTRQFFSGSHGELQAPAPQAPAKLKGETSVPPHPEVPRINTETISTETKEAPKTKAPEPQSPRPAPRSGGLTANSSPDPGSFTALFRSSFKSETKAPSESVGAPRDSADANAGDFTDFFRGPFDGERPPAETPIILPKALDTPPGNAPGEFTRVFGSGKEGPFAVAPPSQSPAGDTAREPGAFTQLFPEASQPAVPSPTAPLKTREAMSPSSDTSPLSKEPAWPPPASLPPKLPIASSIEPIPPRPTVSSTMREAEPSQPKGATHVFSGVDIRLGSSPPPLQGGPSEYTRIISGGMTRNPAGEPPVPKMPSTPVPPIPKVAVPPPPKFSPPAAPVPKPKPSYLPLIIILNVLLFVAILLIVYFAVKH